MFEVTALVYGDRRVLARCPSRASADAFAGAVTREGQVDVQVDWFDLSGEPHGPGWFDGIGPQDRADPERRTVYASGSRSGVPPVCTALWDAAAWSRFNASTARVQTLERATARDNWRVVSL